MDFKRIIQFGIIRSGSTYVYQIVNDLYPDIEILKTHKYIGGDDPVVITIRDPRDSLVSTWRTLSICMKGGYDGVQGNGDSNVSVDNSVAATTPPRKMNRGEVEKYAKQINIYFDVMNEYCISERPFVVCCYEDFMVDANALFDSLEKFFEIEINEEKRVYFKEEYSMEKNRERASHFKHFGEYSHDHKIHGMHVYKGAIGDWENWIPKELHGLLEDKLQKPLKSYGYLE